MELKILIWIVLGLIYLFARKKKKPEEPTAERRVERHEEYESPEPASKPMTFEDLLKEIEGSKKPEPIPQRLPEPVYEAPKPKWEPYNYDEENYEEEVVVKTKPLEDTNYDYRKHDKIYEEYDTAKKYAFVKPSLEETMKIEDTVVRFNQFKEYAPDTRHQLRHDLVKELKNPQSFKKAFILSEILQRKF